MKRTIATMCMALLLVLSSAVAAQAAAPSNDDRADATAIQTLPYSDDQTVDDATTETGEPGHCGSDRSVWYRHTAAADGMLTVSTAGSTYHANPAVYEGSASSLSYVACRTAYYTLGTTLAFPAEKGRTYYIKVAESYTADAPRELHFSLRTQAAITTAIAARSYTPTSRSSATVTGTIRCSRPVTVTLSVGMSQDQGSRTVHGYNEGSVACDGSTHWLVRVRAGSGDFATGPAAVSLSASAASEDWRQSARRGVQMVACTQIGTLDDDTLTGTSGRDRICGLAGDDTITTGPGRDTVDAGPGVDEIATGAGDDMVDGATGADRISAGGGDDVVIGEEGADVIKLGGGDDLARGGAGSDSVYGQDGADRLYGGAKRDLLNGGGGRDACVGGSGRDTFRRCESTRQ